jgi:hypothetical protein
MVRVDFFKESGKWHDTVDMEWLYWEKEVLIHDAFLLSLRKKLLKEDGTYYEEGTTAVCLEPYHESAHPLMIKDWTNAKLHSEMNYENNPLSPLSF